MCLSTEAFVLFLNLIGSNFLTNTGSAITIHATTGDVHWHAVVDEWCTAAPYAGRPVPFLASHSSQTQALPRP